VKRTWKPHCKVAKTADEMRRDLVRFSYSANRGWSYRYDKSGKPTDAYLRELVGIPTFWERLRIIVCKIAGWRKP
jgi:hypothetical protein